MHEEVEVASTEDELELLLLLLVRALEHPQLEEQEEYALTDMLEDEQLGELNLWFDELQLDEHDDIKLWLQLQLDEYSDGELDDGELLLLLLE